MNTNEMFEHVKERSFFEYGLDRVSIDVAFFNQFDNEFKQSEVFTLFMKDQGEAYVYINNRMLADVIQPIVEEYFKFCRLKFESLSVTAQVDLAAEEFFKQLSFYRGSKIHGFHDNLRKEMLSSDLDVLFNGDYYADILLAIGSHFKSPVSLSSIKPKLKKEIVRLIEKGEVVYLIREQHCFKYMNVLDSIFNIKELKATIKEIKLKHGVE